MPIFEKQEEKAVLFLILFNSKIVACILGVKLLKK
jgi:hypothetical protein